MCSTEIVVVAWLQFLLAVAAIEQTLSIVALLIAVAIVEYLPAANRRRAIAPRIDAQRTVAAIEVARVRIAFFVALSVSLLFTASILRALYTLSLQIQFNCLQAAVVGAVTAECWIEFVACFSRPRWRTQTREIIQFICTCGASFARIRFTFVVRIDLAVNAASAEWTIASIAAAIEHLTRARIARIRIAIVAGKFAVFAIESVGAHAMMSIVLGRTETAILTRRRGTQIDFDLTMTSHVSRFTATMIVVDQLDAVECAGIGARIRQTLVDITFAFGANESGWTATIVAAHFVYTGSVVVACVRLAVVSVDFAIVAERSGRTRAHAAVDQVVARATVSAWIRFAVVDVQLTVLSLESFATNALIRTDQIFARAAILARRRFTFVDLLLTVRTRVALMTVAFV